MSTILREVTKWRAPFQAIGTRRLARSGELDAVNPETAERYRTLPRAMHSVLRLATREGLHAYTVHELNRDRSSIGIATIFRNVRLRKAGDDFDMRVHDLDYSLRQSASDDEHISTANQLIRESAKLAFRYDRAPTALGPNRWDVVREDAVHAFCASIDPTNPQANRGFRSVSQLRHVDAEFVGLSEDYDRIAKGGAELEIYFGHEIIGPPKST